jgi:GntR family transcriptional repressor for pyruvate dehydrogenase complex
MPRAEPPGLGAPSGEGASGLLRIRPRPVRRALFEQVAEQLRAMIASGELPPDSRLPAETELAQTFGVSRGTMREALRSLVERQLIRTSKGPSGGNYVRLPSVVDLSELVQSSVTIMAAAHTIRVENLLEVRELLEPLAARLAAERCDEEGARELWRTILPDPRDAVTQPYFDGFPFHEQLLALADNPLLYLAAQPLFAVLHHHGQDWNRDRVVRERIDDDHRAIAAAIVAGEGDEAERLMQAHLAVLRPVFIRIWDAPRAGVVV